MKLKHSKSGNNNYRFKLFIVFYYIMNPERPLSSKISTNLFINKLNFDFKTSNILSPNYIIIIIIL